MNYDTQQYAFSHGLATTPQLQLQQHQLHQQQQQQHFKQQQIFQQQYSQAVPTSNVYQFHFAGGCNPVNPIFQQKDTHPMGISGSMQSRMAQHNMVPQPFIKQGLPVGMDGGSIHVVGSLNGMIYSQQKNNVKIITNPDGRIMQQPEGGVRMQQALVGVDMLGTSNFIEQSIDAQQQQHQGMRVAGQGNMFTYNKQPFSGWLQPQQMSAPGATQHTTGCQSTLPSFSHIWSQFPHQKQIEVLHQQQQQHINQFQQSQQIQQQQQQIQTQQHFTAPGFQTLPGIQVINMQQKPQQIAVPVSVQTVSHLPQQFNCFSPSQSNIVSPDCIGKEIPNIDRGMHCLERDTTVPSQTVRSLHCTEPLSSCGDHQPPTAVAYTISGPPKVTVTLDSLSHSETFSPNHFPGRSEASLSADCTSPNFIRGKSVEIPYSSSPSLLHENCSLQPQREWQISHHPRNTSLQKPLMRTPSTGSSFERSSSESSSFSSPPYTFTPPSSIDSMFSPMHTQFPRAVTEGSSSGRTSVLSSSSSLSLSSSPPATLCMSSWPGSQPTTTRVPTVTTASSVASSTCTTLTATVVFSCNTMAITTTSVTSTTPSQRESTCIASVHSGIPLSCTSSCLSEAHSLSCSPVRRPSMSIEDAGTNRKVQVPYSWHRKCENGVIVYLSPSGTVLQSFEQICRYLLSDSTCKCGLECPVQVEKFFNFDPEVESQPWTASSSGENLGNLCNHRREIVALAAFHNSQAETAEKSAGQSLEMGKKRERNKSVSSGEGLIVAPLKRLKTSITNAVNKHAMSAGSSTPHISTSASENPLTLSLGMSYRLSSESPVDSVGGYSNHSLCHDSPAGHPTHGRPHCSIDDHEKMPGSMQVQQFSSHDDKPTFLLHQQFHDKRPHVNSEPRTFMPEEGNLVFHQSHPRESVTCMPNHYTLDTGFQGNQHRMRYPQLQLSRHHHQQQSANPGMFFPQSHAYPNMPHATQQRPQGFHPGIWHDANSSGPAVMPHRHPPYPPNVNFQHSNFSHPQPSTFTKHGTSNQLAFGNHSLVDSKKAKSKRPKSKKDKQKQINSIVDRSSPCLKVFTKPAKTAVTQSTSASFFGNPIVFVEQQTAMINNSIASCHMTSPTPSPPQPGKLKPVAIYQPQKDTVCQKKTSKPHRQTERVRNTSLGDLDKDEEEDQKAGTDLDSNKSFSDATENNDSAYLSQTGSDQERSDVTDGLDSCLDTMSKSSDVYYFNSSEEQEIGKHVEFSHTDSTSLDLNTGVLDSSSISKNTHRNEPKPPTVLTPVSSRVSNTVSKCQETKKTTKPRQRTTQVKRDAIIHDIDLLKKSLPSSLNGDLSLLLASNNWNIPALQQVLVQYSGGDSDQLNAAVQHVRSQAVSTGAEFPASNLLSAAARAQLNQRQKEQSPSSVPLGIKPQVLQNSKTDILPASNVSSPSVSDSKSAIVSTAVCGTIVSSVIAQQPQLSLQHVGKGTSLIGNMMHFQQLPSGSFAMNMLLPASGQGQAYASDTIHAGAFGADQDLKSGQGTMNPLMSQGILATVSQTGDLGSQMKLPVPSVIPSSLPNVAQCNPDGNTVLLNSFAPRMIMNAPIPPVSVSVMTNVTDSLNQVVPAIGINQTVFSTHHIAQQLLCTPQNGMQIINTGTAAPGTHIINTSPQGAQLVTTAPQGTQFVNPTVPSTQLVGNTPQTSQIVNALSVQGLNNQLLIANPIQQVSPSNSLSQLSPAVAAHILTQGHQHLQQMSPSFLQSQLHKQNPVMNSQSIFASVSLPTLTVTSGCTDAIASSISQAGIISGNIHRNPQVGDVHDKVDISNSLTQVKDATASLNSTSVYAATSQPVFVIPQASTNPVMQMLGPAQTLNTTSGLSTDLNVQQSNLSHIFGQQSAAVDQSQIQNLLAAGFNPLAVQQMVNAVSMSGVQQQQQLQILQLQQLMLQQLQSHGGQNIQGISLPINQTSSPSQATTLGAPTIMNAIMPQQGLQLNSVMDINSLHPCLSPVTQGYQNQLPPATTQLQHISSALTVQQMSSVNSCGAVGVVQNGSVQNLIQAPAKHVQAGLTLQPQSIFSDLVSRPNQSPTTNPCATPSMESQKCSAAQAQQLTTSSLKTAASTATTVKPCQLNKPKPKSKSKKSESKKTFDPETERNEEDIAATVQQILAQAVQQQKELSLAAKNQPPAPPKSKSKKSQSRSKVNQAAKEHDLGKLVSISDDVAITRSEDLRLKDKPAFETSSNCPGLVESNHFSLVSAKPGTSETRQSLAISQSTRVIFPSVVAAVTPPHTSNPSFSGSGINSPAVTSFVEQTLSETNFVNCHAKKSSISLKDHLSSIISKDKDGNNKKVSIGMIQKQGKGKDGGDTRASHTIQPAAVINGDTSFHPKTQRKSIK